MIHTPDVSVIVPCYNAAKYLPFCLRSIQEQSLGMDRLPLIFIDDASTDDTLHILQAFEASYPEQVILIPLAENQGQGYARNLALEYALGTYILYVDADDAIAPYTIELLLKHAAALSCDMLEFDFFRQENPWQDQQTAFQCEPSLYTVTDAASRQMFCTSVLKYGTVCNKLYRRSLLQEHQIRNAEHLAHEDTIFSQLATFYVTRYAYLSVPLYYYRPNPQSTMLKTQANDYHQFDRLKVQIQFLEECEARGLLKDYYLAIETMFIRTYYLDTLLFLLERFSKAPLRQLREMQDTVATCFPSYCNNPFLFYQQTPLETLLLSTLDTEFSQESFTLLKTQVRQLL